VHLILTLSSIMKGPERGKIISRRSKGIVNLITPWRPAVDTRNRRGLGSVSDPTCRAICLPARGEFQWRMPAVANKPNQAEHPPGQYRGKAMKVFVATLTLLVSSAAAAEECQTCSMADACIKAYLKATSEAQSATKQAIRDWKQNLDRKASAELSSRGTLALQDAMESQIRLELERLKECLAKIR